MNELLNKTLSQIVTENYQAASVFEKYGLDFCCKGKRPLQEACREKQIGTDLLLNELNEAIATVDTGMDFNSMSLTELSDYIEETHHSFVKLSMPQIFNYVLRVASKHGDHFPYMKEVYMLFSRLKTQMDDHLLKEEKILFPRIRQLEEQEKPHNSPDFLSAPISAIEGEHDEAGTIMEQIRTLTHNYLPPAQACTTFRLSLSALKAFEEDLHQHVHLENNILFPRAIDRFRKLSAASLN